MKDEQKVIISDIFFSIFSILINCYLWFVVSPIGNEASLFSEGREADLSMSPQYALIVLPVCIFYWIYLVLKLTHVHKYLWGLVGPVTAVTVFLTLFFALSVFGGTAIWTMFILFPLFCVAIIAWSIINERSETFLLH